MSISEVVAKTRDTVLKGQWDQATGLIPYNWRNKSQDEIECCIGSKLFMYFYEDDIEGEGNVHTKFLAGIEAFAQAIGGNRAHMILMCKPFCDCNNPFGAKPWNVTRKQAWDRLSQIEKLPSLCGANLFCSDLMNANLSLSNMERACLDSANVIDCTLHEIRGVQSSWKRADLTGADLYKANLERASLSGVSASEAKLEEATLTHADMSYANFNITNLRYANLAYADLKYTDLTRADLSYANLAYADLFGADLSHANLEGVYLKGVNIQHAKGVSTAHMPCVTIGAE